MQSLGECSNTAIGLRWNVKPNMDYLRKCAGWIRAHKKFLAKNPPRLHGFRMPELSPEQVEQMEQNRERSAARKTTLKRRDNLIGREFGLLFVWELHAIDHAPWWHCLCACGDICKVQSLRLIRGKVNDCGCRRRERDRLRKLRKLKKAA